MAQQEQKLFGDDINSTSLASLQQLPAMTSKADGGNVPLEPPVYNPSVPVEEKRVRFEETQQHHPQPQRQHHRPRYQQQQQQQYYQPPPPPPPLVEPPKKRKIVELLGTYGQHMIVFALVFAILWYYSTFASTSYFGNGTGYVSVIGGLLLASISSGIFGISKHLLD